MNNYTFEEVEESEDNAYRRHPSIANSDLKYIESPRLFQLNKAQQLQYEESKAMSFGSFIDDYLLSPDVFNKKYMMDEDIEKPTSPNQVQFLDLVMQHEGELTNDDLSNYHAQCYTRTSESAAVKLYKSLEDYIDFIDRSKDKVLYSEDDLEKAKYIVANIQQHKLLNDWIFNTDAKNQAHFTQLEIVDKEIWGVSWKGKLDKVIVNFEDNTILNLDLKSTSKSIASFHYYYRNRKYYRQQALYRKLLLQHLVDQKIIKDPAQWIVKTRIMLVQSVPMHECAAVAVPERVLQEGEEELKECADLIKYYNNNGWDQTKSYKENNGLELYDWSEAFDNL